MTPSSPKPGRTNKRGATQPSSAAGYSRSDKQPDAAERFRQTRRDHAWELAEDYVELIGELMKTKGEARLVDIAQRLGVSHVTANQTIRRLQQRGLVRKEPYRAVFLTEAGAVLARKVRKRHEIVFRFLKAIGVPAVQAQIDAEGIEHHISDVTLRAMGGFLKKTSGHGRIAQKE